MRSQLSTEIILMIFRILEILQQQKIVITTWDFTTCVVQKYFSFKTDILKEEIKYLVAFISSIMSWCFTNEY